VGQQQRVAAARALLGSPPLLIADEPTSALDAEHRDSFIQLLLELSAKNNTTVIFVTHDAALSRYFDSHVELNDLNKAGVTA
jgi:putative ABC transport system ATP-binding protein